MRRTPARYGAEDVLNAAGADELMEQWCERDIKLLQQHRLITYAPPFACTEYGNAMSRYMVQFETMKLLLGISRGVKLEELVCMAEDLCLYLCARIDLCSTAFHFIQGSRVQGFSLQASRAGPFPKAQPVPFHSPSRQGDINSNVAQGFPDGSSSSWWCRTAER